MNEQRKRMIEALNSIEVIDWSASCGELEYVSGYATEEDIQRLLDAGFKQEMIDAARDGMPENEIELLTLAVNYAGIFCWHKDRGFVEEDEWNRLAAAQGAV